MSRNAKLRELADKLPPVRKLTKDGQFMFDEHGHPIMVDHFSEMISIRNAMQQTFRKPVTQKEWDEQHKLEMTLMGDYAVMVNHMAEKERRKRIVRKYQWIISTISMSCLALYIYFHYICK